LRSMEKLRVWKHQSIQIILQEVMDSYVTKTLSLQETPFKTSQSKLRLLNSNQKMWRKPRERLSTTFTSKTFQLTTLMLKSRICLHHSEPSSLVLFNQTISENLPLFAMMIQ
jgi:PIN domain nuclease of toxin-antitoxin system